MGEQDVRPYGPQIYQATIKAKRDAMRSLRKLNLDQLPNSEKIEGEEASVEALIHLDQVDELIDAGASVDLQRRIDPKFPDDRIMSEDQAMERLQRLEPYREDREDR